MIKNYILLFLFFIPSAVFAQQSSLLFDGVDDKVVIPDNPVFNPATALTVEAWINATQWKVQSHQGTIVGKDQSNTAGYVLRCGDNGKLSFTVGSGGSWVEVKSAAVMQSNTWCHVAGVLDNGTLTIYINGSPVASGASGPITVSTTDLQIGESTGFPGRVFQGYIDEVRIWNVARTQQEIMDNDTIDLPSTEPGLVAYYKFNQVSGTTTPNEITTTPNSTGTLVNFPMNPWGQGYTLPGPDMTTTALISPDQLTFYSGASRVRAKFRNNGTDTVSVFSVGYQLNNDPPVMEGITQLLQSGEEFEYAFHQVVEATGPSNTLRVFVEMAADSNSMNDTLTYQLDLPVNNTIVLFDNIRHDFGANGQAHLTTLPLPDDNTAYIQILMTINLMCPATGCDPWDQPAKISLLRDGQSYELARFITPYGKACGPWTVDVTSFKSMLQGACTIESYIQVWGTSGWMLDVSLEFIKGSTPYPYQKITRLWETDNWVYGDPGISYDLPLQSVDIHAQTQELEMRMTNTGHGQANTDNAAEFSPKTQTVMVNGATAASHYLWKANCGQNICNNQFGTWQFARAGWCPGQEVQPYMVNLNTQLTAGQSMTFDYVLQAYTNLLNTGYNGGSHTEPHYKIHAFAVEKSAVYIADSAYHNASALRISFPLVDADMSAATVIRAWVRNTGTTVISQPVMHGFIDGVLLASEPASFVLNPGDSIEYTFTASANLVQGTTVHIAVLVELAGDEATSDDVASIIINDPVSVNDMNDDEVSFMIFPNPSVDGFTLVSDFQSGLATIEVVNVLGETVYSGQVPASSMKKGIAISHIFSPGTYIVKLYTAKGISFRKMLVAG